MKCTGGGGGGAAAGGAAAAEEEKVEEEEEEEAVEVGNMFGGEIVFLLIWVLGGAGFFGAIAGGVFGLGWMLSSLGVFLRDIGEISAIMTTILLFLSPIFFPIEQFPEQLRFLLYYNPLTLIIEAVRDVAIFGRMPNWSGLAIYAVAATAFAQLGYWMFVKSRRGFSDVL